MSSFEHKRRQQPHLRIPEDATESQLLIFLGEEALERAHQVSHGIEEQVHRLLADSSNTPCSESPNQHVQLLSNHHAGDEQGEAKDKDAVDKQKRRW